MKQENAIDVKALLAKLWNHRLTFLLTWIIATVVIGAATYLLPRKYKAVTTFVPEYNLQETKQMRDIFYELNLNMEISPTGDMIVPEYYAKVVGDTRFLQTLSAQTVTDRTGSSCTIAELFPKAKCSQQVYEKLKENIQCKYSRKDGSSSIAVIANDPYVAQQMAVLTRNQLSERIAACRQENTQRNIDYYSSLPATNQVAQQLLQMEQVRLQQHQPVFVVLTDADASFHAVAPKRIRMVFFSLFFITLLMVAWYWRKDIPEWL